MTQKLFLILCCYACFNCIAQAPGYMGKKLSFGYGFHFNPALSAYGRGSTSNFLNKQHEVFLEYVVGKRVTLVASAKVLNSSYNNTRTMHYGGITTGFEEQNPEGSYSINASMISIYSKIFRSEYAAPWGKYYTLGLTLNLFKCQYDPHEMYIIGREYNSGSGYTQLQSSDFGPTEQNYKYPDIIVGVGRARVFWDWVILDYGYNLNLAAVSMTFIDVSDRGLGSSTSSLEDYIKLTSHARMRGINRFNLYIKIGLLF